MKIQEALGWIAEIFEEPVENVNPDTAREGIPGWDSMGVLALMAGMDKDFDIVLAPEEIQGMKKVSDILRILQREGKVEAEEV